MRTKYGAILRDVCLPDGRHLTGAVAAVNDDIGASGISASIASQVHIGTFQLFGFTVTAHGNHALPQILGLLIDEIRKSGVNVPGRNAVDTGKITPLIRE